MKNSILMAVAVALEPIFWASLGAFAGFGADWLLGGPMREFWAATGMDGITAYHTGALCGFVFGFLVVARWSPKK